MEGQRLALCLRLDSPEANHEMKTYVPVMHRRWAPWEIGQGVWEGQGKSSDVDPQQVASSCPCRGALGCESVSEPETPAPVSHWLRAALGGHHLPGITDLCRCGQSSCSCLRAVLQWELRVQASEARSHRSQRVSQQL